MKGLIVDPSRTYQKLLASALESGGIKVTQVATGGEAFKLLGQQQFNIVCVAMHLPDMEGTMFSSHLRANIRTRQLPLIMITSSEDKKTLDNAIALGVTEVFAKDELDKITNYAAQFSMIRGNSNITSGRILYIEDSPSVAAVTTKLLENNGFYLDHFATGEQGMEAFKKNSYDLVLTDIVLEGRMSGYGIVRAIRDFNDERARIPILALSGFDDAARKIELLRSGANDYVAKPMLNEELIARVNNLVTNKKLMDKTIEQQYRMEELAMKDQLTGLYNRHFLMEAAPSKLSESLRQNIPCSLLVMDADKFKLINDNYGHATGDIVLKEMASVLLKCTRKEDIAARFGGEEFVLLLSHCNISNALARAEKIRQTIENLHPVGLNVTVSFGVAEMQQSAAKNFTELFQAADAAVYQAKSTGRNKVVTHS